MLKYEWISKAGADATNLAAGWRDKNGGKEQNRGDLTLEQFAAATESYFLGLSGGATKYSVRIYDSDNREATLWGGDTVAGFRFYRAQLAARQFSRRFRRLSQ